jgi:hypothetical protein
MQLNDWPYIRVTFLYQQEGTQRPFYKKMGVPEWCAARSVEKGKA